MRQAVLVMQNSASLALYTNNATMLQDAYTRAMSVMTVGFISVPCSLFC